MERHEKKMIRDNYSRLVENVNPMQIIPYLPCLLKFHREEITTMQHAALGSRLQAAIKLFDILQTRPKGFKQLVEALRNAEVGMDDIADRLDPPDDSSVQQRIEKSEMTQKENTTQRLLRKPSKKQITMETPFKLLPLSVINRLKEMDAGQFKNADKLAEVIGLIYQEVENIKAHCGSNDSLTIKYLKCWNEKEEITLLNIFQALDKVGRIDLIEELNDVLKVNFQPKFAEGNGDVEENGARNDLIVSRQLTSENQQSERPQKVQPCSTGYPNVTGPSPNGVTAAGDVIDPRTDGMPSTHMPNTIYSRTGRLGIQEPNVRANSNLPPLTSDRVSSTPPSQQREDVHGHQYIPVHSKIGNVSPCGRYTDNSKQVSVGSLDSNKRCEKTVKFSGYATEELISNNRSECDRYTGTEKEEEDLKKDNAGRFVGYTDADILGADCNSDKAEAVPPQTIMDNQRVSSKPLEHRFNKDIDSFESSLIETPDMKRMSPRSELNFDGHNIPVFVQNDFDRSTSSSSSNTDNSAYASLSSTGNQDLDSIEKYKKEDDAQKVCVEKLENRPNEMGNIADTNMIMPSNVSVNETNSEKRSDSVKSFEVRRFERDLLNRPEDADWLMTGYESTTSRKISNVENSSCYSYVSQREDIDRPKLSVESGLDSIKRKAKKAYPGVLSTAQQMDRSLNLADDDDDEHVSVDGESPGIGTGVNQTGKLGDTVMNDQLELSPVLDRARPSQNQPYSIQQPPNVPNFGSNVPDTLPHTEFDLRNASTPDNQRVQQLVQFVLPDVADVINQDEVINLQGTAQFHPHSVHEPPRLIESSVGVSHANSEMVHKNGKDGADKIPVTSEQEVSQVEVLDRATDNDGRGILYSSLKVAFKVVQTTYDSLL